MAITLEQARELGAEAGTAYSNGDINGLSKARFEFLNLTFENRDPESYEKLCRAYDDGYLANGGAR